MAANETVYIGEITGEAVRDADAVDTGQTRKDAVKTCERSYFTSVTLLRGRLAVLHTGLWEAMNNPLDLGQRDLMSPIDFSLG